MKTMQEDLDRLKAEISFHTRCKPCKGCGECERILDIAIREWREARGGKATVKPCESCRI